MLVHVRAKWGGLAQKSDQIDEPKLDGTKSKKDFSLELGGAWWWRSGRDS